MSFHKTGNESFNVDNPTNHQVLRKLIEKLCIIDSIFFFFFLRNGFLSILFDSRFNDKSRFVS